LSLPDVRVEDEFEVCTELGVGFFAFWLSWYLPVFFAI
jgi:hypothetical protein